MLKVLYVESRGLAFQSGYWIDDMLERVNYLSC